MAKPPVQPPAHGDSDPLPRTRLAREGPSMTVAAHAYVLPVVREILANPRNDYVSGGPPGPQ
jgi:hypothetical protein